jgi:hypothetical protein
MVKVWLLTNYNTHTTKIAKEREREKEESASTARRGFSTINVSVTRTINLIYILKWHCVRVKPNAVRVASLMVANGRVI